MRQFFLAAAGGAAICAAGATAAFPQGPSALPGSLDRAVLVNWLRANTDLDPTNVISVSPANIIGVMAVNRIEPADRRVFRAQIRSEVISAQTIREAGNSSWAADVEVDCQSRKGKVNRILDFPMRNLRGTAREAGGSAEWVAPPAGTHLYTVVAAVCDAGFQRPLAPGQQMAALGSSGAQPPVATAPRAPSQSSAQASPGPAVAAGTPAVSRSPAQTAPAPRAPAKPVKRSSVAVQIAAADTEAKAAQALRSAMSAFAAPLDGTSMSTVRVEVGGKTVYRALLHGFASADEAQAFCTAYKAAGRDCFLRDAVPAGAKALASR